MTYKLGLPKNGRHSVEAINVCPAGDIAQVHGDIAHVDGDVTQVNNNVAQVDSNVAQLRDEIAQIDGDVANTDANVAQVNGDIDDGEVERGDDTVIVKGKFVVNTVGE